MMIEKIVLDYLNKVLAVPAFMETPADPPELYVLVEKTGSGRSNRLNTATIVLQSYAGSLYGTAVLNEAVKAAMDGITSLNVVSRSRLNSDYNYTDAERRQYRYQAVYDLTYHD